LIKTLFGFDETVEGESDHEASPLHQEQRNSGFE